MLRELRFCRVVYPCAGLEWKTDDRPAIRFLGPSRPFIANSHNANGNSVVFRLRYKSFCMLFTGDAGAAAEEGFFSEGTGLRYEGATFGSEDCKRLRGSREFLKRALVILVINRAGHA